MAGGGLTLLRKNDAYVGWAKEATWGTAVAPTSFWRWAPGTSHKPQPKFQKVREGDTQIYISLIYKTSQLHVVKVVEYGRPVTLGCALQGILGTGSDALTAATNTTTTAGTGAAAGGTTVQLTADQGNVGTRAYHFDPFTGAGPFTWNTDYEVVTLDLTTRSGVGPFTYTVAASGTFKFAHVSGQTVRSTSTHVLTAQRTTYDPYTLEVGLGPSGNSPVQAYRYRDAVCSDLTLTSGPGGTPIKLEHTWYCANVQQMSALTTVVAANYEGTNIPGGGSGPLLHSMAGSTWNLDGAGNVGNAATIKSAQLKLKRALNAEQFVTEAVTPNYFLLGNLDIDLSLTALFQSYTQYREAYLNSSAANLAVDAFQTVYGTAAWTYTGDAANSLAINLSNAAYTMADLPALAETSDPMEVQIQMSGANSPAVQTPLTLTLANSNNTAY